MEEQPLSSIIKEYAKRLNMKAIVSDNKSITTTSFYKTNANKLKEILTSFNIKTEYFLSKNRKSYFFNDSQEEIIKMLYLADNSIVQKLRGGEPLDYKSMIFDEAFENVIHESLEFVKALKKVYGKEWF